MKDKQIIGGLIALAVVLAGVFCVTFSTLTQSVPLILLTITGVLSLLFNRKGISSSNSWLKILTLITVVYLIGRAYFSPIEMLSRQDLFLISGGAMLYLIIGILAPSKIVRSWITAGFLVVMVLNLFNWLPAVDQWRDTKLGFANGEKNTGLFNHRNFFGNFMFMMTCLCGSMALFSTDKSKVYRLFFCVLGVAGAASVVLSTARASFLALAVGCCVLVGCYFLAKFQNSGKKQRRVFIVLGASLLLVIGAGLVIGGKYVIGERSINGEAKEDRGKYFAVSLEQIPEAPIIGSGSRSVEYKSYEYWPADMYHVIKDYRFVHNEYLQAITDYGVMGFLLLFMTFIGHIINGIVLLYAKIVDRKFSQLPYLVAGLSIMLGLSINMLFSFPMHGFVNLLFIVFAATMLLGATSYKDEGESKPKVSSMLLKPMTLVTLFVLTLYNGVEGSKEFLAGRAFIEQGIIVDDQHWTQGEEEDDQWLAALSQAVTVSPNYSRYNRLGEIYFANGNYQKAAEFYKLSKERHPYSPTSRISLARLLTLDKQFAKAEKEYLEVEYLVKNREPLFYYYRNLADFYLLWAAENVDERSELLMKARKASELSVKKLNGIGNQNLRRLRAKILLACYYNFLEEGELDQAYTAFDEFVTVTRQTPTKDDDDARRLIASARELLKHADFAWNQGMMERAAKATYRAKRFYQRYKNYRQQNVDQSLIDEEKKIDDAINMFKQAGIEIDRK